MLGYYRRTLISLFTELKFIVNNTDNLVRIYELQLNLIEVIKKIERRITHTKITIEKLKHIRDID